MKSKTVKESGEGKGTVDIEKEDTSIMITSDDGFFYAVSNFFTPNHARKLFEAGIQMCDELERK